MEFIVKNTNDIPQLAIQILQEYADYRLFALAGEIGAGKTTLVKAICEQVGVREAVTSPTFSLVNVYEYLDATHQKHELYHIDLYRLKSVQEAIDIGIEDYLFSNTYCFVEWYELIETLLPDKVLYLKIIVMPDESRLVKVTSSEQF